MLHMLPSPHFFSPKAIESAVKNLCAVLVMLFSCLGNEDSLTDCPKTAGRLAELCGHKGDAAVKCVVPTMCHSTMEKEKVLGVLGGH